MASEMWPLPSFLAEVFTTLRPSWPMLQPYQFFVVSQMHDTFSCFWVLKIDSLSL